MTNNRNCEEEKEKNGREKDAEELILDEDAFAAADLSKKSEKLKKDLEKCESERREYLAGWQRAKADFINYKKEEGGRFEETSAFWAAQSAADFLPVLDSFDLALGHASEKSEEKTLNLLRAQFADILRKWGIEEIKVGRGDEFNPQKHESMGEAESDLPPGAVAEEMQKGYSFRGRTLRPARVKIAKGGQEA